MKQFLMGKLDVFLRLVAYLNIFIAINAGMYGMEQFTLTGSSTLKKR